MRTRRTIRFPYKTYRAIPCPIITLGMRGPKGHFDVDAYVDSGAFYSIFCVEDAEMIGLDYSKGKRSHVVVGDGNALTVYFHHLPVTIGDVSFNAVIGFAPKLGVGFNLLGRRSIFERFVVIFDDVKKQVSFIQRE